MRILLLAVCLFSLQQTAFSQKEWSNWYYNGKYLLTFKNGYPENVTNFITNPPPVPPATNAYHFYHWGQQGISYSNPVTGDTRFIISNYLGFASDYTDFPNDNFLRACLPDQEAFHIIPFGNNPNKFYVIQFQSAVAGLVAQEMGLQVRCPNAIGLGYSIVDLTLNGGRGDFSTMNNVITTGLTEQIALVKHANGQDVWIIVHPYNTAQYRAYLVSSSGIQAPVTSTIGMMINGGSQTARGLLTASHDGALLAGSRNIIGGNGQSDIELFDFNKATGILSNYRTLVRQGRAIKLRFSPDNTKLYSAGYDDASSASTVNQWDLNSANPSASGTQIASIPQGGILDMQLAPDGKIYLSRYKVYDANGVSTTYLSAIQCPNLPKYACNFKLKGFQIPYEAAFPSLVNDFINQSPVSPTPSFSIGNDTTICFGSLTISAPTGWQSYKWNTGDTTRSITATEAGVYYVLTGNAGFSCPQGYGYIKVSDGAIKLNLGRDTLLCPGTSYLLHVPNDYTNIVWSNGSNTRDSIISIGGTIIIRAKDVNGCNTSDTIVISHKYNPRADFGADRTLCGNETLLLRLEPPRSLTPNAVYLWQNNSTLDTFRVRQSGTYWGKVTFDGCTVSDTINIQYIGGQSFTLGRDTTLCSGDSLRITAPVVNGTYIWNTGATTQSITVGQSGQYFVTVGSGLCITRDTINVTFQNRPIFSLGSDTMLCEGNSLQLLPGLSGGQFLWQDGSTQPTFLVNSAGLYHLRYNLNGCLSSDSIVVGYKNKPPVNLGNDSSFCAGQQLMLQASSPTIQNYLWQDQSTQPQYNVASTGTYSVTVKGYNGCINSDTINIEVVSAPVFNLGRDTTLCAGKTLKLSINLASAALLWSNGSTGNNIVIDQPGLYWLRAKRGDCTFIDSIIVNFIPSPVVNLGTDTTVCEGANFLLTVGSGNAINLWQDGSTMDQYNVNKPGLYHVVVKYTNGCSNSDSISVKYLPLPIVTLGKDTLVCPGQTLAISPIVNTVVDYRWQDGSNFPSFNVNDTGSFTVTVENICGTARSSIVVRKGICQLHIPNGFTPNNDNINDVFRIKYPLAIQQFRMSVYNRYGQKVFSSTDIMRGWDGKFGGLPQAAGAYVWIISFVDIDGENKTLQGTVLLLR